MEPVPEAEMLEDFRSTPLAFSSRRTSSSSSLAPPELEFLPKPAYLRRATDPSPTSPTSPTWSSSVALPYRPRASSPLSAGSGPLYGHMRSRSAASLAPPMTRAQSLPAVTGAGSMLYSPQLRPQSPSGSPSRVRVPRKPVDEAFPQSPTRISVHDPDRKLQLPDRSSSPTLNYPNAGAAMRLRRPSSPLCHVSQSSTTSLSGLHSSTSSIASSPSFRPSYDSFSSGYGYGYGYSSGYPSSSMPSTPTSTRSRSPSISSLETIPDSPDAEEAALEAERIAQLKEAADAAERGDTHRKSSLDMPSRGRTLSFGSRDKRKRWSVCGAERRQDLDLETIWED